MTMTAYVIDAVTRTISKLEYAQYTELWTHLPGGPCIGMVYPSGDVIYVDEVALLRPATVAFRIKSREDGQPMMSNGVVTGRDDANTTLSPAMTIPELWQEIEWLDTADALDWFRAKGTTPAVVTEFSGVKVMHATWADLLGNLEGQQRYHPDTCASLQRELRRPPDARRNL